MAVSICAFNSRELIDQELIDDGLNLFVKWELSDMFGALLLSRDLATQDEPGEFDQIAQIVNVDIESIYKMSNYWDKAEELEHLSRFNNEFAKADQLEIIQQNNDNLLGNITQIYDAIKKLEMGVRSIEDLKYLITKNNTDFYNNNLYFSNETKYLERNLLEDLLTMIAFIDFVKPSDADTVYFKFKTGF